MANKVIGFRLTGNTATICELTNVLEINQEQVFDIQFFPQKTSTATLTHSKRNEIKSVPVEFPRELQGISYQKAYVFFVQNEAKFRIEEEGYEKLGNRKLVIKFADAIHSSRVNVHILIQGTLENKSYRIYLNPLMMAFSQAEIQEKIGEEYRLVPFLFQELEKEKEKTILTILHKLTPHNITVERSTQAISLTLGPTLHQFVVNPKLLYPIKKKVSGGVEEVDCFVVEHQEDESVEPEDSPLASTQSQTSTPSQEDFLKEIETLVYEISASPYFNEFNASLGTLSKSCLIDQNALGLMTTILQHFLSKLTEEKELHRVKGKKFPWISSFLFSEK